MTFRTLVVAICGVAALQDAATEETGPVPRGLPKEVRVQRDLEYASYGARSLLLDLYEPKGRNGSPLPAIVVIRGGAFRAGDKEGFGPIAAALAQRGFVAVSIEYRASGEASFPAAVHDTKAAVRWLRANAAEYGVDPKAIGAIGGSAGAHLAVYLGVTPDIAELEGSGGNSGYSSAVSAVVGLATPSRFEGASEAVSTFLGTTYEADPELWAFASPTSHVASGSPPLLLMHSSADSVIPFERSLLLAERYGEANVAVEVVLIPSAPHAFWNRLEWFDASMDRSVEFFGARLGAR